jgi:hypothetical protein
MAKDTQVAIRVDNALLELADEIAGLIAESSVTGEAPKRSEVLRAAMRRGLDTMHAELKPKPKRK